MAQSNRVVEAEPMATARYVGGIAKELKILAAKAELGFLSYLLSMAEEEAITVAHGHPARSTGRRNDRRAS